jgi:hypothetical protein
MKILIIGLVFTIVLTAQAQYSSETTMDKTPWHKTYTSKQYFPPQREQNNYNEWQNDGNHGYNFYTHNIPVSQIDKFRDNYFERVRQEEQKRAEAERMAAIQAEQRRRQIEAERIALIEQQNFERSKILFLFRKEQADQHKSERCQYYVGRMYLKGLGCDQNEMLGIHYIELSAKNGYMDAIEYLRGNINENPDNLEMGISSPNMPNIQVVKSIESKFLPYDYGYEAERHRQYAVDLQYQRNNPPPPAWVPPTLMPGWMHRRCGLY